VEAMGRFAGKEDAGRQAHIIHVVFPKKILNLSHNERINR